MGNTVPEKVHYADFIEGTQEDGYTPHLVNNDCQGNELKTKLENGIDNINDAFDWSVQRWPENEFLGKRDPDQEGRPYVWRTFKSIQEELGLLAKGYASLELLPITQEEGKDYRFMGVYAKNRIEFACTILATGSVSGTIIGLYDTLGPSAIEFAINMTELTTISCDGRLLESLVKHKAQGNVASLKNLICFDEITEEQVVMAKEAGIRLITYEDVLEAGRSSEKLPEEYKRPTAESILLFGFTSGTTGNPKAAMISHRAIVSRSAGPERNGLDMTDSYLSYLPMAHSMEQCIFAAACIKGFKIGYYSGDIMKMLEDVAVLKPTMFASVPRLYNKLYDKFQAGINELTGVKAALINRAIASKLYYLENNGSLTHSCYDALVFNKFRAILGGNVKIMVTGAAPLAPEVINFLKICFCAPLCEGYGQTETAGGACATRIEDLSSGTVGGPECSIRLRLKDIPEMNYLSTDQPYPRGEICFQGPSIFSGYYKNPEKNAEAFENGWLRSGDVGMILPNGAIRIIDRAKSIFKLAQGEYIAPEKLENLYVQSPFIGQIFIYGNSLQSYLVAVINIDYEACKKWAQTKELELETNEQLRENEDVKTKIQEELARLAGVFKMNGLEKIKKFILHDKDFAECDLLTPTMKLKRVQAGQYFKDQVEELYNQN